MMFLLPHHFAWAMVANYDVHDVSHSGGQAELSHFGHHEHRVSFSDVKTTTADKNPQLSNNKPSSKTANQANKQNSNHVHYGFCHLSCGEVLSYSLPIFEAVSAQFLSQYSLAYHAPTSNVLDRPKWPQLI